MDGRQQVASDGTKFADLVPNRTEPRYRDFCSECGDPIEVIRGRLMRNNICSCCSMAEVIGPVRVYHVTEDHLTPRQRAGRAHIAD